MTVALMLKRTYEGIALFAVLNVAVAGGMVVYLAATGVVDAQKVQRVAAVLRGEDQPHPPVEPAAEPSAAAEESVLPRAENAADSQMESEIIRREADRVKEELRQRLALNNRILLRITTERENFRREREAAAEQTEAEQAEREQVGFEKQIAILGSVKPKTAVEHLLALGDVDQAAKMLLAMETRKAKKIVEAAKRPDQMEQMKLVVQRLREVAPERSAELSTEE